MLTVRQAAARAALSEWAIRRAIHDGELVAYKPRGQLRIHEADFDLWLEGTKVVARPSERRQTPVRLTPSPSYPEGATFRSRIRRKEAS
jgi:excisionase family DNA binding protein